MPAPGAGADPPTAAADGRFARQAGIQGWDQDRLRAATAVVFGVGALGNEAAKNLALAGVGRLILCDFDRVETGNLSRGVLFRPGDIGRPKVEAAAAALAELAPETVVQTRAADLASGVGLGELADCAVVLGCLDSVRARLRLLGRCALVDAAYVDGGTHPWGGEVRIRRSTGDPCYGCSLPAPQRSESDVPWSCADPVGFGPAAASIASSALVASWMTVGALRILFGQELGYSVLRIDALTGRTGRVEVALDPRCPHHRPLPGFGGSDPTAGPPVELARAADGRALTRDDLVGDLLEALPDGADPLVWAGFPIPWRCRHCQSYAEPVYSAADADRWGRSAPTLPCTTCGRLARPRFSDRLRHAPAGARLSELAIAPEEILPVRTAEGGFQWHRLSPTGTPNSTETTRRSSSSRTSNSPEATGRHF